MLKADTLQAIENFVDSSEIPGKEYFVKLRKENGDYWLDIYHRSNPSIPHMYLFSEILNSYTQDWYVEIRKGHIHIVVK
jgi:hypothetical protein